MPSPNAAAARLLPLLLVGTALTLPALAQPSDPLAGISVAGADDAGPAALDTPQSETVVSRRDLNQRNVQTLGQALAYTPEASVDVSGYDPLGDAVDIRGFPVTYTSIYRDGLRQIAVDLAIPRVEPYGADSVTVLRTPAAGIYGSGSPGGIINVTTKRPSFDPSGEVQFQVGNYGRYQGNVDIGGPVEGSDGTMAYRLTGLVRKNDTYLPFAADDRTYIAPAFTWKPDADTTLTVLAEYMHLQLPGNPTYYRLPPGYVVSRFYEGDPAFDGLRQDQFRVGTLFEHKVSPDLIVRQNLRYAGVDGDFEAVNRITPISFAELGRGSAERFAFHSLERLGSFAIDNQVEGHGQTGPVAHTLIAGLNDVAYGYDRRLSSGTVVPNLNLASSNYGQAFAPPPLDRRLRQSGNQLGLYLQDEAKWNRFVLTLNGRYDWASAETAYTAPLTSGGPNPDKRTKQSDTAFTYRVGLSFQLTDNLVPYASYATFFTPQPGSDPRGNPFDPSRGDQREAGVKFAFPEANVTGSIALFDIAQSSNSIRDLATTFFQLAVGSVESRGLEMEMTANLSPGTSLTLAYRHLDFRFTQQTARLGPDTFNLDGNTPAAIPGDTFSAFGTYLFPTSSPLSGLTLGGGVRFTGQSFADDLNTARNKAVTLFDALLAYDFAAIDPKYKGFRAQINGFNVFDRYFTICQNVFCYRGPPATVIGSLVYRW